jgi:hypothetical protein
MRFNFYGDQIEVKFESWVSEARQRPSSVDPAHDIKASLRKIMDDLQQVAA